MKCLQCGTELDRISKWRGASEYCSEDCKKKNQEELNELVMHRLMMPKPSRAAAVRTVDNGASRLTVVVHPVGASAPVLTEPPEAGFIMDDSTKVSAMKRRDQQPLLPNSMEPMIPGAELRMMDGLVSLAAALASRPPAPRLARELPPPGFGAFAIAANLAPELPSPGMDPVWPTALGLDFRTVGIESFIRGPEVTTVTTAPQPSVAPDLSIAPAGTVLRHTTHQSIPSLRPLRPLEPGFPFELGADRLLPAPSPAAPRLRIHLPNPTFHALCPRFTFAPRPAELPSAEPAASGASAAADAGPAVERGIDPGEPDAVRDPIAAAAAMAGPAEVKTSPNPGVEAATPSPADEAVRVPTFGFEAEKPGLWQRIREWKKAGSALVVLGIVLGASGDAGAGPGPGGPAPKVNSLRGSHE